MILFADNTVIRRNRHVIRAACLNFWLEWTNKRRKQYNIYKRFKKFVHTLTGMLEFKHLVVDHVHQFLHPIPRFTADVDLADHVRKSALLGFLDLYELAVDLHYHLFLKGFWEIVASFAVGEDVSVSAHNDDRSSRGPCLHQDKSCYNTI